MAGEREAGRWDRVAAELHALREAAGTPSYDALAKQLIAQRIADGLDPHAAQIAKSSVHDTFRFGRSRINESLVRELVRVMGGDPREVDDWVKAPTAPDDSAPEAATERPPAGPTVQQVLLLVAACLALNLAGREFVDALHLPVYLDMVGTAVAAIALGPWRGAAVGALTNVVGIIGSGWISLPFALVNVVGALMWGYGVRRWGMGRTLPRFFALNAATAVACTLTAVPVILTFLDDRLRVGHDVITQLIQERVDNVPLAVGFSNLLTSMGDKLVSGFIALVVLSALPLGLRAGSRLIVVDEP